MAHNDAVVREQEAYDLWSSLDPAVRAGLLRRSAEAQREPAVFDDPAVIRQMLADLIKRHAAAVKDDPRSHYEETCGLCREAHRQGLL